MARIACDPKFSEVVKDLKDTLAKEAKQFWEEAQQGGEQGEQGRPGVIPAELSCRSRTHRSVGVAHLAANLLQNEGFEVKLVHDESWGCCAKGCQSCQQPVGSPVEFEKMLESIRNRLGRIWSNTTMWPPLSKLIPETDQQEELDSDDPEHAEEVEARKAAQYAKLGYEGVPEKRKSWGKAARNSRQTSAKRRGRKKKRTGAPQKEAERSEETPPESTGEEGTPQGGCVGRSAQAGSSFGRAAPAE